MGEFFQTNTGKLSDDQIKMVFSEDYKKSLKHLQSNTP